MINFSETELEKIYWVEKKLLPIFHEYENLISVSLNKINTINSQKNTGFQIKISFLFQYKEEIYLWSEEGVFELTDDNNLLNSNLFSQLLQLNKIQVDFYVLKNNTKIFFEDLKNEIIEDFPFVDLDKNIYQFHTNTMQENILFFYGKELTKKISTQYLNIYLSSESKKEKNLIKI